MGQMIASFEESKQSNRYFEDNNEDGPDFFDTALRPEGYDGWIWREYPDLAKAYLTGDMARFNALIAPDEENGTNFVDDLMLYALSIRNADLEVYRFGYQDEGEPFVTIKAVGLEDSSAEESSSSEAERGYESSSEQSDNEAPRSPLTNKTNVEVAREIIATILSHAGETPACFNPDHMLTLAVDRRPSLVSKVLTLPIDVHPASALPKVSWKGREGDIKYAAIKELLLTDPRVNDVNVHAVSWAAFQGDLERLECLLNDPTLVVSETDNLALYWAEKNDQLAAFKRLLQDPRFGSPDRLKLALNKKELCSTNKAIPMVTHLLKANVEASELNQEIFSNLLLNATRGKAVELLRHLLENNQFEHLVRNVNQETIGGLFLWGSADFIYPDRTNEICALLHKHFVLENKSKFIARHAIQSHELLPYVKHLIFNESEMLDLIKHYADKKQLIDDITPSAHYLLWGMQEKIKTGGFPVGSFDQAFLKMYDSVPRPPEMWTWEHVVETFHVANIVASFDTLVTLAERLKSEMSPERYQHVVVSTLRNANFHHINSDIQQQKVDAFMLSLDLSDNPDGLGLGFDRDTCVKAIKLMSPPAFEQLLAESDDKDNKLLSKDLCKIKNDKAFDDLFKENINSLLTYQARLESLRYKTKPSEKPLENKEAPEECEQAIEEDERAPTLKRVRKK